MRREVSKEVGVRQVPPATGIISHGIARAGDVVMHGNVSVVSLVKGVETQKVGTGGARGGRPFGCPGEGGAVIAGQPNSGFGQGAVVCQNRFMGDGGSELEIRDRDGAGFVVAGDEFALGGQWKRGTPEVCAPVCEPDAAHAALACVARARSYGVGVRDQFG